MRTVVGKLLKALRRIVIGAPLPSYSDVWRMFKEGGDLQIVAEDLAQGGRAYPEGEYEAAKQLRNAHMSVRSFVRKSDGTPEGVC